MNWKGWIYSLISAGIGGAASALGGAVVAPSVFNFTPTGLQKLGELAIFGFAVPVLAYLKTSPLPPESQVTTVQNVQTSTTTITPPPGGVLTTDATFPKEGAK